MRAYEFPLKVTEEGDLEIPDALRRLDLESREGRVIILIDESSDTEEQAIWHQLTQEEFLARYSETDAIYDTG